MAWWWRSPDCMDFYWGVLHHPAPQLSACIIFIFRRCMVQHFQFLILLASQTLTQMDFLRTRSVCCESDSLRIPDTLSWHILGVPCPLPRCFVVGGLLRLCWAFLGTLAWRVPGLLWRVFLARFRRCLGGPYHNHCPPTCSPHCLGVLPFSGFSFFCAT